MIDRRSDKRAASLLEPLSAEQRERLVAAMRDVERLLTAASVEITHIDPEHADAKYCLAEYVAELNRRARERHTYRVFDPAVGASAHPHELRHPAGAFFVAYLHGNAVGCGGVKHHRDAPAEIKRMWIAPHARGLGLGRRLLDTLEACACEGGSRVAHIETSAVSAEALSLYRSSGWVEVPRFNDEPFADHWFEKRLTRSPPQSAVARS